MTLSTTTNKNVYVADGTQTTFQYTFKILKESDLEVILQDTNGNETVQTLNTDYTVTGVGSASGGNVVFTTAPTVNYKVIVHRVPELKQETDYVNNSAFNVETLEQDLDKIVMVAQYLKELLDRTLLRDSAQTSALTFPSLSSGKFLTNDGSGLQWGTPTNATYNGTFASGNDADKPASPSENDIYFAKDTLVLYVAASAGVWSAMTVQRGNDANKPASPAVNDAYLAVDTGKLYYCKTSGSWTAFSLTKIADSSGVTYIDTAETTNNIIAKVNGVLALQFYDNGVLSIPKQSCVRVHRSADQLINYATTTKIQFDTKDIDTQNEFDTTTNYRFTANKAGTYLCSLNVVYKASEIDNYNFAYIYKNGVQHNIGQNTSGSMVSQPMSVSVTDIVSLNAGDYLEFYTRHEGGTSNYNITSDTFACVIKVL